MEFATGLVTSSLTLEESPETTEVALLVDGRWNSSPTSDNEGITSDDAEW